MSSVASFSSCLQSFPASESFPVSWLFESGGQSIGASASVFPMKNYSELISFRVDWFDLLAVQRTLKSLLQNHSSKASILQCSALFAEKAMAPPSRTVTWKIPWMEEPGGLPSLGSHRVGHDCSNLAAAAAAHFDITYSMK